MSLKNTLMMALVLGLVGLFIFKYEIPRQQSVDRESFVVPAAADGKVKRISISGPAGSYALVLSGEPGAWQIEGLPEAVLDSSLVTALTDSLQAFKSDSVIPAAEVAADLGVYGLSTPALTIEAGEGDARTAIAFGKKNEFISKRYARVSSQDGRATIVLTDDSVFTAASKSRDELRDRNPLQFPDSAVATVIGEWKGSRLAFEQVAGVWRMSEPVQAEADPEAVLTLVRELRGLKVSQYIDQVKDLSAYRLDKPDATFSLLFRDAKRSPVKLSISAAPPQAGSKEEAAYFSLGGETVFKVAANPLPKMLLPASQFRVRRLFTFEVEQAHKMVVSRASGNAREQVTMEVKGNGWTVNGKEGDPVFVLQYLNDISFLEATDFPAPGQKVTGLDTPSMVFELTLRGVDGKESRRTLVIGDYAEMPSGGNGAFAADRDHMDLPFMVSATTLQKLVPKVEALMKSEAVPAAL